MPNSRRRTAINQRTATGVGWLDTTASRSNPEVVRARRMLAEMIWASRKGDQDLGPSTLRRFTYSAQSARVVLWAMNRSPNRAAVGPAVLGGRIVGDLLVDHDMERGLAVTAQVDGALTISAARIAGDVVIAGPVAGSMYFDSSVEGHLNLSLSASFSGGARIEGEIAGDLGIQATIAGDLEIDAVIAQNISILARSRNLDLRGEVQRDVEVRGKFLGDISVGARIGRSLVLSAECGSVKLRPSCVIGRAVVVAGSVDGSLRVEGRIDGDFRTSAVLTDGVYLNSIIGMETEIAGRIGGSVAVLGECGGRLSVSAKVAGYLYLACDALGATELTAEVEGRISLVGSFAGPVRLDPRRPATLSSLRGSYFNSSVNIGELVRLDECDFSRCRSLEHLRFYGYQNFTTRVVLSANNISNGEMVAIYRALRQNFEGRGDRPGAGDFYYGEMRYRLRTAMSSRRYLESVVLALYWAISGYGLRPWRAFLWFVAVAAVGTLAFGWSGGLAAADGTTLDYEATNIFVVKSMVSFLSPPAGRLSDVQEWIQLGLRFLGPIILAQAVIAIRERVAR